MKELETTIFKGKKCTIDYQLAEIRFMEFGEVPKYIPFDSGLGQLILLRKNKITKKPRTAIFSMDLFIEAFFNWLANNWLFIVGMVVALTVTLLIGN